VCVHRRCSLTPADQSAQKLIKRTIFHDHTALLNQRQDEILEQLKVLATEGFPKAQEEWEKSLQNYGEFLSFYKEHSR
jgi:hypothetical protein